MKFQFPEFLYGLFLVAIPIIIHLFNFRKFKKVYFSNTRLLRDIKIQTSSKEKIKERLILLSRILAVIFLVFAFAKPYFPTAQLVTNPEDKVVSIYLDNSYSMEAVGEHGTLLQQSQNRAKEIVKAYPLGTKFQVFSNNLLGQQNQLHDNESALAMIDSVAIGTLSNNLEQLVKRQSNFLTKHAAKKKDFYLISDFQKTVAIKELAIDSSVNYHLVNLQANALPNISIDSAWFISPLHQPKAEEKLIVRIRNYSDKAIEQVSINLEIDGKLKTIGNVALKANATATDTLIFSGLTTGWRKGKLSIKDYPIVFDDSYYFSFLVKNDLPIYVISYQQKSNSIAKIYATDPFFKVENIGESEINYSNLKNKQLVVLRDLVNVSQGLSEQLKAFVLKGGNVAVYFPLNAELNSYQQFLNHLGADYPIALQKDTVKANRLNIKHPVFNGVFEGKNINTDLPKASAYFKLSNKSNVLKDNIIAENNLPLWNSYKIGKGNVYVCALPLEQEVSNLSTHALFLPIAFKMALIDNAALPLAFTLGQQNGIQIKPLGISDSEVLHLKGNNQDIIPDLKNTDEGTFIFIEDQVQQAGFYNLTDNSQVLSVLAFNENRKESVNEFYSKKELATLFNLKTESEVSNGNNTLTNEIKEVNLGTSLWKLCIILVLVFLAIEILLIRFFSINNNKTANK